MCTELLASIAVKPTIELVQVTLHSLAWVALSIVFLHENNYRKWIEGLFSWAVFGNCLFFLADGAHLFLPDTNRVFLSL